jgi:hypothetical protein
MLGIGILAVGAAMVVYGLGAEYVYNDVDADPEEEEATSRRHLLTVVKGIGCVVFAAVGMFFGWFS